MNCPSPLLCYLLIISQFTVSQFFFRTPTPSLKLLYMLININICIDKLIPIRLYEVNHRQRNCDFVICDDAFFYK